MQNIVVIFQATSQHTESLALAVGLGAVQAGANIRLRHLDPSPVSELAHAGYGTLRVEDLRWAGGAAFILENPTAELPGDLRSALKAMVSDETTGQRWFYLFHSDADSAARRSAEAMLKAAGFTELPSSTQAGASIEQMTAVGHALAAQQY